MNADWINFLKSRYPNSIHNSVIDQSDQQQLQNTISPLTHLAILKVTGDDASHFLQGQLTCNINELDQSKSFFTAFCNAKGRTICTLLIIKTTTDYLLILPAELIDKVSKKLQMYIMRSKVQLSNVTNELCLTGIQTSTPSILPCLPETAFTVIQEENIIVKFPLSGHRYLVICPTQQSITLWTDLSNANLVTATSLESWNAQDISAGIPWLTQTTSEVYIPQMLNIDKLGGISFTKGCYTGQEIIARTHYLGKAKRELFLAYCENTALIDDGSQIMANNNEQTIGKVLSLQTSSENTKILIVIQSADAKLKNLTLNNSNQDKINIIEFQ